MEGYEEMKVQATSFSRKEEPNPNLKRPQRKKKKGGGGEGQNQTMRDKLEENAGSVAKKRGRVAE